jgi:DNA invertase Pin-like site-specific DNA recombinase
VSTWSSDLIRERTRDGLDAARRRGKRLGRPRVLSNRDLARVARLHGAGRSIRHIATVLGVSRSTVARTVAAGERLVWTGDDIVLTKTPGERDDPGR